MLDKTEEIFYLAIVGVALMLFVSLIFILSVVRYQKRVSEHIRERLAMQAQFSQTLLQSQIEIQEQTLRHISRELHDNLGHSASLIKIYLNTLKLTDTAKAHAKIEDTKDLTRKLISDIKSLSVSMGTDRLAQGDLVSAIEAEAERLNKTGQFLTSFTVQGIVPVMESDKTVILYRMIQEVLNNMVKHSGAKQITIDISVTEKTFNLAISDNGIGFNVEEKLNGTGAGLRNLSNRAHLINAQLQINSTPGNGTNFTIILPL